MQNKRGLSDVVTTLLIILLAVVAVAIIGGIVLNQVNKGGLQLQNTGECSQLDLKPVKCGLADQTVSTEPGVDALVDVNATYNRGASGSGSNIVKVSLVFTRADGSTAIKELTGDDIAAPLNSVTKIYVSGTGVAPAVSDANPLVTGTSVPANLRVAATIRGSDGKDVVCEASQAVVNCI